MLDILYSNEFETEEVRTLGFFLMSPYVKSVLSYVIVHWPFYSYVLSRLNLVHSQSFGFFSQIF